ncbi:diguanylate phosphodiesterase, partial [Pseudomonas aeruginosa]
AQALVISLVVEGVESDEQRVRLIQLGCHIAQRYLFARPMPEQHFLDYCYGSRRRHPTLGCL